MEIILNQGEKLHVSFRDTDRVITIDFNSKGDSSISVHTDMEGSPYNGELFFELNIDDLEIPNYSK